MTLSLKLIELVTVIPILVKLVRQIQIIVAVGFINPWKAEAHALFDSFVEALLSLGDDGGSDRQPQPQQAEHAHF